LIAALRPLRRGQRTGLQIHEADGYHHVGKDADVQHELRARRDAPWGDAIERRSARPPPHLVRDVKENRRQEGERAQRLVCLRAARRSLRRQSRQQGIEGARTRQNGASVSSSMPDQDMKHASSGVAWSHSTPSQRSGGS
jgi:hypothetical protein